MFNIVRNCKSKDSGNIYITPVGVYRILVAFKKYMLVVRIFYKKKPRRDTQHFNRARRLRK